MSVNENLKKRLDINNDTDNYLYYDDRYKSLKNMQVRLNMRGGTDQWTRMREDKLSSLKKALLYSYQSAVVQKFDVKRDNLANAIISIVTLLQDNKNLNENQLILLENLEEEYQILRQTKQIGNTEGYIRQLQRIVEKLVSVQPLFRCLINHDKLKVDYEDKIISIPFCEPPIGSIDPEETNFHNGTVFKWVHGNKEEWTPDTYWIVYMQYSEETAYFRGEIRKADEEIEIITVDEEGNETSTMYRGWMTGPNETTALWNVKKGVVWNDLNYTKLLYITKDEDTLAFFQRFDRVMINGKPWEVQAYNENYSTSKSGNMQGGIIRVALKETYTSTDQMIREMKNADEAARAQQEEYDSTYTEARIEGPSALYPYDIKIYKAKNFEESATWSISDPKLAIIKQVSEDGTQATVEILTGKSNAKGFDLIYGNSLMHITIQSL